MAAIPPFDTAAAHALPLDQLEARLECDASGLTQDAAERRLAQYGPNRLATTAPVSALKIFVDQFRSIVVVLLIAAAAIALWLREPIDALAIGAVLAINTALGFYTELRARRAMAALLRLDVPMASVIRDGQLRRVDAATLVPGDLIQVDAGQHIPADARIVDAADLRIDEAALTGESLPVSKTAATLPGDTPLAERTNMVYKGTTVATGTGRALVTGTGQATELGRIGALVSSLREEPTPLERRLDELGGRLVWLALGVALLVALIGVVQGAPVALAFETALALAVAAVPEALPAVATIALAVGVHRMARRQALVRRLAAVESLGSTTVICTDKTRTLTSGDMSVVRLWSADQDVVLAATPESDRLTSSLRRALEVAALASRAQPPRSSDEHREGFDPVDAAMLRAARDHGVDVDALTTARERIGLIPFSSVRKLMASFHRESNAVVAYVKGAPGRVLAVSDRDHDGQPIDAQRRQALAGVNEAFARAGLRVLALASGPVEAPVDTAITGLTFVGYVGLMDPPAPRVRETIVRLKAAGLRTVMLTGDQRLTAEAVGRELGLLEPGAVTLDGRELERMPSEALADRIPGVAAFSRISPEHKLTIVSALQARGEIVAMLGDGVNDAPALKKADVGVAMGGRGTDVAKEAAAIVLRDDRFETIAAAVEEGRIIFDNIRKFVFYLFSCNVAEILVLLGAGLAGHPMPLAPLQLLWLNMVTDTFPALALAMEPGEPDVMARPPRDPQEAILSRAFLTSILLYSSLITAATLAGYAWTLARDPDAAQTVAFMTLALAQTFHLGNARSAEPMLRLRQILANPYAIAAVAISVGLQLAAMYVDTLARLLRVQAFSSETWIVVIVCSVVPAIAGQAIKLIANRQRP